MSNNNAELEYTKGPAELETMDHTANAGGEEFDPHLPQNAADPEYPVAPVLEEVLIETEKVEVKEGSTHEGSAGSTDHLVERAGEVVEGVTSGVPSATLPIEQIIPPHVPHVIKFFNEYWDGVQKEIPFQESGYLLEMSKDNQLVVKERPEVPPVADGLIVKTVMPNDKRAIIRGTKLGAVCVFETELDGGEEFPGMWHSFAAVVAAGVRQVRAVDRPRGWEDMLRSFTQWLGHPSEEGYVNVAFYVDEQYGAWKKYFEKKFEITVEGHKSETEPTVG